VQGVDPEDRDHRRREPRLSTAEPSRDEGSDREPVEQARRRHDRQEAPPLRDRPDRLPGRQRTREGEHDPGRHAGDGRQWAGLGQDAEQLSRREAGHEPERGRRPERGEREQEEPVDR
jgi:hypothetical protein